MKKIIILIILLLSSVALAKNVPYNPADPNHNNVTKTIKAEVGALIDTYLDCYDKNGVYDTNFLSIEINNLPDGAMVGEAVAISVPLNPPEDCVANPCLYYSAQFAWMPGKDSLGCNQLIIECNDSFLNNDYGILEVDIICSIYAGDINNDCYVDLIDIKLMADKWLEKSVCPPFLYEDLNNDCKVDLKDFAILSKDWLKIQNNEEWE